MVPHQRREYAQLKETREQVLRDVASEAAQVTAAVQEAAHVQPGQHLQRHFQVAPPGEIIPLPDAAVPVRTDERGAGEQQETAVRIVPAESVRGGTGHVRAVKVVHPVMADGCIPDPVVKPPVVIHIVADAVEGPLQLPHGFIVHMGPAK